MFDTLASPQRNPAVLHYMVMKTLQHGRCRTGNRVGGGGVVGLGLDESWVSRSNYLFEYMLQCL